MVLALVLVQDNLNEKYVAHTATGSCDRTALGVGHHPAQRRLVGSVYHYAISQLSLTLGRFLGQDMIEVGLGPFELPAGGTLEAFRSPSIGFQFWHDLLSLALPALNVLWGR
jgi:hypothetical protein